MSHADHPAGDHGATRRDFLYYATAGAGAVAAGAAAWTLINQMNPSADVQALSSIQVDISGVAEGTQLTVKWLGKPVFIRHRTPAEIEAMRPAGRFVAETLATLRAETTVGTNLLAIDRRALLASTVALAACATKNTNTGEANENNPRTEASARLTTAAGGAAPEYSTARYSERPPRSL